MPKAFVVAAAMALAALLPCAPAHAYRTVQVSRHVHVFEAAENPRSEHGNVVAVIGREAILVVDTGQAPEAARRAVADLRSISALPVRYVVNTHYRGGQLLGNAVFKEAFPEAVFLAHRTAIDEASRFQAAIPRSGDRGRRYLRPDFVVDEDVRVELGGLRVMVRHLGPANTPGDLIVWVEADKVVATGDMLVAPGPDSKQLQRWVSALAKLRALEPRVIVPGHGPAISEEDDPPAATTVALAR